MQITHNYLKIELGNMNRSNTLEPTRKIDRSEPHEENFEYADILATYGKHIFLLFLKV